jgi:hypothetical protein
LHTKTRRPFLQREEEEEEEEEEEDTGLFKRLIQITIGRISRREKRQDTYIYLLRRSFAKRFSKKKLFQTIGVAKRRGVFPFW